jgi:hypothetical protein
VVEENQITANQLYDLIFIGSGIAGPKGAINAAKLRKRLGERNLSRCSLVTEIPHDISEPGSTHHKDALV